MMPWLEKILDLLVALPALLLNIAVFAFLAAVFLGPPLLLISAPVLWGAFNDYRRGVRLRLFSELAWATERNLPLDPMLAALEKEAWNGLPFLRFLGWRGTVATLRDGLAEGRLLADAARPASFLLGCHRLDLLAEAEKAGRLGDALRLEAGLLREEARERHEAKEVLIYPVFLFITFLAFLCITSGVSVFILPQFAKVMADVGMKAPSFPAPAVFLAGFLLATLLAGGLFLALLRTPRPGWLFWLPLFGGFFRLSAARNFCEVLGALLGPGVPLHEALRGVSAASRYRPIRALAGRLAVQVEGGGDAATLMGHEHGLPAVARELIALGVRAGSPAHGCACAAAHLAGSLEVRRRVLRFTVAALIILAAGALVASLAATIFGALVSLIHHGA
jgi:type II secretory pathway component PulF